ncbi:MAG: hypothetical protein KY452_12865 [Actinobacteria bacterium]|nr:hypothetical protein [Actinomycetota bacterium]
MWVVAGEEADVDGVDQLYELEPGQFVAARDRLARALRAAGDREAATAVRGLRRPTLVAWALNQVARARAEEVAELIDAGAAVGRAQAQAMGGGASTELRAATRRRRELTSTLARAAADLAGANHHDEAVATLDAASLDPEVAELLRRGRLTRALPPPSGFGMAAMPEPAQEPALEPKAADASVAHEPPDVGLEPLRRDLDRAEEAVAGAEALVAGAEEAVAGAEDQVRRAEEALAEARTGLHAAGAELDGAVAHRERARAALEEAESGRRRG